MAYPRDKGVCKFCGKTIYWIRTAKNNKPTPIEIRVTTIYNKDREIVQGHEPHHAHCPNYPGNKR